jgi:hypothetical protein
MSDLVRLASPKLAVQLADGSRLEVQTANPDLIRYERTAARHKWPVMTEAPVSWLTFLAWAALRREGQLPAEVTWERFSDELCLAVERSDDDDSETDDDDRPAGAVMFGDPTQPVPDPG